MKKINIKSEFSQDYISREAGEKLRTIILENVKTGAPLTLDFSGLLVASTSFFDEGFAKLTSEGWDQKKLFQTITFEGLHPKDKMILDEMCKNRGMR